MGHVFWIASVAAAAAVILGLSRNEEVGGVHASLAATEGGFAEPDIGQPEGFGVGRGGDALAMAAFGMSALQPETYNGELVLGIIEASPLDSAEKVKLARNLEAAESGEVELAVVLQDVRIALAVD